MKNRVIVLAILFGAAVVPLGVRWPFSGANAAPTARIKFVGTQYDLGGTFFPIYEYPQKCIVPWRTNSEENVYAPKMDGNQYYGTAGYALFATQFAFPNANPPDSKNNKIAATATPASPQGDPDFPNLIDLPDFVADWQIVATRMAGGWSYALIDDPRRQHGERRMTFDGKYYPPRTATNVTKTVPYVKLGILDGPDQKGDAPELGLRTGRWAFTVGQGVPKCFRIGIMTDGLDNAEASPGQVFVRHVGGHDVGSHILECNRFVDMHFFDITDSRPGDEFVISAAPGPKPIGAGISGFTFDIVRE